MKKLPRKRIKVRRIQKKTIRDWLNKGNSSLIFLVGVVALSLLLAAGFGSYLPATYDPRVHITPVPPPPSTSHNTLQLNPLTFISTTDTPAPPQSQPALCQNDKVNDEPEILAAYFPASGQTVSASGQIKVWITDEGGPFVAPGKQLNADGTINVPGDQAALAPDKYLWEPALYIAPQTAETGGTPHFPSIIKGDYNPTTKEAKCGMKSVAIDTPPAGTKLIDCTAEYIWDVNTLSLTPGSYQAEFVIHDGDDNRGVGCVNINIQ